MQGVISNASFRLQPRGGKSSFTVMSMHINNNYAKKRGIGKKLPFTIRAVMLDEHKDLVVGDFNGAAWRRQTNNGNLSIIEEAFADSDLPMPPGPTPLWGSGTVPGTQSDVCGFLKPPRLPCMLENTSAWCIFHSPRNFGPSLQGSKLSS